MSASSLSELVAIAPAADYPSDKTTLIKRLRKERAKAFKGTVAKGQKGLLYEIESLPPKLRLAVMAEKGGDDASAELFKRYKSATKTIQEDAQRRLQMVRKYFAELKAGVSQSAAKRAAADAFKVTPATVKNALKLIEGAPEELWLPLLVKSYASRPKKDVHPEILRYFFSDYGRVEKPQAQAAYERVCAAAATNGWGNPPGLKTMVRRFNELSDLERTLLRDGEKALKNKLLRADRDRSAMVPLEKLNIDSRIWDLFVRDGDKVFRPTVTMLQDCASNFIVAYEITETESSASYRRVIARAFTRYGIAQSIMFDNTHAASAKILTAGAKKRFRFKTKESDVPGLLIRVCCDPHFAEPFNGPSKLVERSFGEIKERSEKRPECAGAYCGPSPEKKPANYGERAVDIAVFSSVLDDTVNHYNTRTDRRGKVAYKTSHKAVFEQGLKTAPVRKLSETQRRYFFLDVEKRTVSPSGEIRLGKRPFENRFQSDALREFAGQKVFIRFDPDNLSAPILVETTEGRLIDAAVPLIEKRGFNSADDVREHMRQKRAAARAVKERVRALNLMSALELQALSPVNTPAAPPPDTPLIAPTFGQKKKPAKPVEDDGRDIDDLLGGFAKLAEFRRAAGQ